SIAVDASGSAYVTGLTESRDFPTTAGAFDTSGNGPLYSPNDAFVTKLDPTGAVLVYSTYLGGGALEIGQSIAVDASGNAYAIGDTESVDFPTTGGAFDTQPDGRADVFITKLNISGTALVYSTYLGGTFAFGGNDEGFGVAVDETGSVYLTGSSFSIDFPT